MKKNTFTIKDMTIIAMFCALIIVSAQLSRFFIIPSPLGDAHFTPQWLIIVLTGLILGRRKSAITVGLYLLIGLIGFPVFASGGGMGYLLKPTFGFLIGYLVGAYITGLLSEKIENPTFIKYLLPVTLGFVAYYLVGWLYCSFFATYVLGNSGFGLKIVFMSYCFPTIVPDYIFAVVAALIAVRLKPIIKNYL